MDLDDIAAGYISRQRWADEATWVRGPSQAHPPVITPQLWHQAKERITSRPPQARPGPRSPRVTTTPYVLRGLVHCGICNRKMEGATSHGIMRYRCRATQTRSLPAHLADYPKALSVREDAILPPLDRWIAGLADPAWLADSQAPDVHTQAEEHRLREHVATIDTATKNLVAAIEAGTDPTMIQPRLAELAAERNAMQKRIAALQPTDALTAADIDRIITELGGLTAVLDQATRTERMAIYGALGLRLTYQPDQHTVVAEADLGRVASRVGGGT